MAKLVPHHWLVCDEKVIYRPPSLFKISAWTVLENYNKYSSSDLDQILKLPGTKKLLFCGSYEVTQDGGRCHFGNASMSTTLRYLKYAADCKLKKLRYTEIDTPPPSRK